MQEHNVITVEHVHRDGWHTFTCLEVPGFHLVCMTADLEIAYQQIPEAIAEIVENDAKAVVGQTKS